MKPVLRVENLSKTFALYKNARERLLELVIGGQRHRLHRVLDDINFSIQPGESVGILGVNGAGKSTLLKLITGVLIPDAGAVHIEGRVAGLLELGTGFDMRLSGRQNIYINAQLNGLSFTETVEVEESIIEFAELQDVIDDPMRTYSSGMVMRLGFAVAIHTRPSCFVLDEALAVGDASFQQKCLTRLKALRDQGTSMLVVSHDLNAIQMLCDRAILLDQGKLTLDGHPVIVCQTYLKLLAGYQANGSSGLQYGKSLVCIKHAAIQKHQTDQKIFMSGERACITVIIESLITRELVVGVLIKDKFGQDIYGINTQLLGQQVNIVEGGSYQYEFQIDLTIAPGYYTVTLAIHGGATHLDDCECWWDNALQFEIQGYLNHSFSGVVSLPTSFQALDIQ